MKFYITTAIDYVNAKPHIGHAYQKVIADMLARWHKIRGEDVFFLTGTDEHGQKIEESAKKAGLSPREFVDRIHLEFKKSWKLLHVDYDRFIRTTDEDHEKSAKKFIENIKKDIYKSSYEGLYCVDCENYLTEKDLIDGKCPWHGKPPQKIKEDGYFFRLSKYEKALLELYEKNPEFILPDSRRNEIRNRVKEGLKDLYLTRKVWGIKFPLDKEFTIYVWVEALLNYISGIGWPSDKKFKKFWPADIHLLGKDNGWFHCVIWPALLMSGGVELPKTVFVHGFLTVNGQKISKSLGNVIAIDYLVDKYTSDGVRYLLVRETPLGQDGDFSEKALVDRYNNELANNFGNFAQRTIAFIWKNFDGKIPEGSPSEIQGKIKNKIENTEKLWSQLKLREGVEEILSISSLGNEYFQKEEPWKAIRENKKKAENCLYNCTQILKDLCILFYSIVPESCEKLAEQLNVEIEWKNLGKELKPGHKIGKPEVLFKKIEPAKTESEKAKKEASLPKRDSFSGLDLRVARILEVRDHPNADKLYVMKINCGEERTIVAGIKQWYKKEELEGKKIVVVANLEQAELRGVKSEAMLLAGEEKNGNVGLLFVDNSNVGEKVVTEGIKPEPKPQVTFKEFKEIKMKAGKDCVLYKNKKLVTESGETVKAERVKEGAEIC